LYCLSYALNVRFVFNSSFLLDKFGIISFGLINVLIDIKKSLCDPSFVFLYFFFALTFCFNINSRKIIARNYESRKYLSDSKIRCSNKSLLLQFFWWTYSIIESFFDKILLKLIVFCFITRNSSYFFIFDKISSIRILLVLTYSESNSLVLWDGQVHLKL